MLGPHLGPSLTCAEPDPFLVTLKTDRVPKSLTVGTFLRTLGDAKGAGAGMAADAAALPAWLAWRVGGSGKQTLTPVFNVRTHFCMGLRGAGVGGGPRNELHLAASAHSVDFCGGSRTDVQGPCQWQWARRGLEGQAQNCSHAA
eukprot:365985-Chlamydomonas_euryale.AAC.2